MRPTAEQLARRLEKDPHDAEAYDALRTLYRATGDIASLTNLVEGWAQFQTDPRQSAKGFLEAARDWRAAAGEPARTRQLLTRALERDPSQRDAAEELVSLLADQGDTRGAADFLDSHLRRLETRGGDPIAMAALYTRLGDLWRTSFQRPEVAGPCYQRALELDPLSTAASEGARESAHSPRDAAMSAHLLAAEADTETDPDRKVELYLKLASVQLQPLGDVDAAVRALRAGLTVAPTNVRVMHQLAICLSRRAAAHGGEEAERDTRRVAELYYQIAEAVSEHDALEYLGAALAALPTHEPALLMLEQLATKLGREALLAPHWVSYLARATPGPETDARRLQLARAYAQAGQLDDAIYCLEQAHDAARADELLRDLRAQRDGLAQRVTAATPGADSATRDSQPPAAETPSEAAVQPRGARVPAAARPSSGLPPVAQLRRAIHDAIASRDSAQAATHCRDLLAHEPGDAEAYTFLESYYRRTRDHARLRELLLASSEVAGLALDTRKQRLAELATLSETKLKDIDGAIDVWRNVVALDPEDTQAKASLRRLFQRTQRWDELAALLEREVIAATQLDDKTTLLGQIVAIHRDKRDDLAEAADALRQLFALAPDTATRDELCDALLSIGQHAEAVPLLRERIASATHERDKLRLLRVLAETLDEKQHDLEGAYTACSDLLALRPKDIDVLLRMERIDERTGDVARLIDTLERHAALAPRAERPALLSRMAELSDAQLDDVERAAEFYARALDLEPDNEALLDALCRLFERRERYTDLAELLKARIASEKEPARRVQLVRRRARVLKDHLQRDDEAAEAYRGILAQSDDEEALQYLLEYARGRADSEAVAELSGNLARVVADLDDKRALLLERARVLRDDLERPREAARALRELVEHVDPNHEQAIDELSELCDQLGDAAGLSVALRRKHARTAEPAARAAIAQRLSDLCEHELRDADAAIAALTAWTRDEPQLAAPHRRLVKLLQNVANQPAELIASYDALSRLEDDPAARTRAALDAAKLAFRAQADVDGAFLRLGPLVEAGDDDALEVLAEIAAQAGRAEQLAALCVTAAQRARDPVLQGKNWRAAAHVFGKRLSNSVQALEAALRMLATNLGNREHLAEVEHYAALENAWPRLAQVYERLIKTARDDAERAELLLRHADVLETRAEDPSEAFNRVLRASALAPDDETLLARAEELAKRSGRGDELLALYEARARGAEPELTLELLLRAARLCDGARGDRARANAYLKGALAVGASQTWAWERVVRAAEGLDRGEQRHGPHAALRQLIQSHYELAERAGPELGPRLILRADGLVRERLRDDRVGFDLLRRGHALFPADNDLYEALAERATAISQLDALDQHLSRCIDRALDPDTASALLARRAALLEGPLGKPQQAVDVLTKLLQLKPDDSHAAARLRRTLRKSRRFQDLLLVIHKQLQRASDPSDKLALLKESASVWETDLKNRYEARDAWRKVLDLAPSDPEAQVGLSRVEQRLSSPQTLSELPEEPAEELDDAAGRESGAAAISDTPRADADVSASTSTSTSTSTSASASASASASTSTSASASASASAPEAPVDGSAVRADRAEDTREIDVDVDLLTTESGDEIDAAIEAPRPSRAPGGRSLPPPPPKSPPRRSSQPPPPPRKS